MEKKTIFDEFMNMSKEETSNLMKDHFNTMDKTQEFLNTLTHQEKVNLTFQLMDYISEKMYVSGDTITIVTNEYSTEE
jgi:hypothetical protein